MIRLASILAIGLAVVLSACDVGDEDGRVETTTAEVGLVDADGDGTPDGLDLDGDGAADVGFDPTCTEPLVDSDGDGQPDGLDLDCDGAVDIAWCEEPLVDADGDGVPEGIDLNCDGESDLDLDIEIPDVPDAPDLPDLPDVPDVPDGCVPGVIDADGDGQIDGIDLDCDGAADLEI